MIVKGVRVLAMYIADLCSISGTTIRQSTTMWPQNRKKSKNTVSLGSFLCYIDLSVSHNFDTIYLLLFCYYIFFVILLFCGFC